MDSTEKLIDLLRRLGETHRNVTEPYPDATEGTYTVHCPAGCNGGRRQVWRQGDPDPSCDLWREYHALWTADDQQ